MAIGRGTLALAFLGLVVLIGLGMVLLAGMRAGGGEIGERIRTYAALPEPTTPRRRTPGGRQLARLRRRMNLMLSALGSEQLSLQLMSANWRITTTEYVLIRLGLMVVGFALGWAIFRSSISGLALAIIANLVPGVMLRRSINRRQVQFERQLVDVLVLINGAVRSGFSLLQALEVVEREVRPPASEEFHRVRTEVGLGLSLTQALNSLNARMQNDDLNLIVTAVNIHSQVGGNLSTMLAVVTDTVRDRDRLFREARVLTTQQRYTSYLLSLLPIVVAALIFMINPNYISQLFISGIYILIPIGAIIGIILGHIVIQRIARIEV